MEMSADTLDRSSQIARALNPSSVKLDERDNRDRLAFVSSYARLIHYYNHDNHLSGNWQNFFIKDPSILLAHISKTDYEYYHSRFMMLNQGLRQSSASEPEPMLINQLCQLLKEMFATINQWARFMALNTEADHLQLFLKKKIHENLSGQLALLIAIQQRLSSATRQSVVEPDTLFYRNFEALWHERAINLSALAPSNGDSIRPLIAALLRIYHVLFNVLMQAVEYATQAFYQTEDTPSRYPDTALMIVFSRLMESQQKEINKIGNKHLNFYYDRILHQSLRPAQPDHTFVSLKLADGVDTFSLPAGTLFRAGSYPDQSDILFCNAATEDINQATISTAYTLHYDQSVPATAALYLNSIATPKQVVRNSLQEIVTWEGFGNTSGIQVQQGFALASPMLLLQGGLRTITIAFTLDSQTLPAMADSQYYLSTATGWLPVAPDKTSTANTIVIVLQPGDPAIVAFKESVDGFISPWPMFRMMLGKSADLTTPPLLSAVSIKVEVDQFSHFALANDAAPLLGNAPQPIFGMVPELGSHFYLGSNECFAKPLSLLTLTLNWDKLPADLCTYYLAYNRYLASRSTASDTDSPGPFNNTAFIGQWSWLNQKNWQEFKAMAVPRPLPPKPPAALRSSEAVANQPNVGTLRQALKNVVQHVKNTASKILQYGKRVFQWISNPLAALRSLFGKPAPAPSMSIAPTITATTATAIHSNGTAVSLFQERSTSSAAATSHTTTTTLRPNSVFTFILDRANYTSQPTLALTTLPLVSQADNGYLRLTLTGPDYAFGNSIYSQVVSQVSLNNAQFLIRQANTLSLASIVAGIVRIFKSSSSPLGNSSGTVPAAPVAIESLPNVPYVPRQSSLQGAYSATAVTRVSASTTADYPLQVYHYGSFKPYLAYDATSTGNNLGLTNLTPKDNSQNTMNQKLHLFPGVSGEGCLYASFGGVQAPCSLTLYAEISADENKSFPGAGDIGYYYWSNTGWRPLTVLYDDTGHLSRSGIIKFDIPFVIVPETPADLKMTPIQQAKNEQAKTSQSYVSSPIMPNTDFWLAIATKSSGINIQLSYLNTQTIKLTRCVMTALPVGETPQINAGTITGTKNKVAQIASITQPFPSFGGLPAENKNNYGGFNSFYRRVSTRLNNKDRAVSNADFAKMAHEACCDLYSAIVVPGSLGEVRVGLVKGYANAQLPNAFRPVVNGSEMNRIIQRITQRVSSQARISINNLKHQIVTVSATLLVASNADIGAMKTSINQMLQIYLSPWISSDMPQANLGRNINQSALINLLATQNGVVAVKKLALDGVTLNDDETIFVSAMEHTLTFELVEASHGRH